MQTGVVSFHVPYKNFLPIMKKNSIIINLRHKFRIRFLSAEGYPNILRKLPRLLLSENTGLCVELSPFLVKMT